MEEMQTKIKKTIHSKIITYMGQKAKVACDGICNKAWGRNNRSKMQLNNDPDDFEFLADHELDIAPIYPGTYEGDDTKPSSTKMFPNKWCVRECERRVMSSYGNWDKPLELINWNIRN